MSSAKRRSSFEITPRLMRRDHFAFFLGVSPSKLDKMVKEGVIPPPKQNAGVRTFDIRDGEAYADSLPYDGAKPDTSWDD